MGLFCRPYRGVRLLRAEHGPHGPALPKQHLQRECLCARGPRFCSHVQRRRDGTKQRLASPCDDRGYRRTSREKLVARRALLCRIWAETKLASAFAPLASAPARVANICDD